MGVKDELEAGPEQHGGAVDIALQSGHFAALQRESEMLRQADEEEDADAVKGVGC